MCVCVYVCVSVHSTVWCCGMSAMYSGNTKYVNLLNNLLRNVSLKMVIGWSNVYEMLTLTFAKKLFYSPQCYGENGFVNG